MRIGDSVRPELGATDYSAFLKGASQGSAAMGQGIAQAGAAFANKQRELKAAKQKRDATLKALDAFKGVADPKTGAMLDQLSMQMETAPLGEALAMSGNVSSFLNFSAQQAQTQMARDQMAFNQELAEKQEKRAQRSDRRQESQDRFDYEKSLLEFEAKEDDRDAQEGFRERELKLRELSGEREKALHDLQISRLRNPPQATEEGLIPAGGAGGGGGTGSAGGASGQFVYRTKADEVQDTEMRKNFVEDQKEWKSWRTQTRVLRNLKKDIDLYKTGRAKYDVPELWNGLSLGIGGSGAQGGKVAEVLENRTYGSFEQKVRTLQKVYGSKQAKLNQPTGVLTDGDREAAERQVFHLGKATDENLRIIDGLIEEIEKNGKRVENQELWLKAKGTLLGFTGEAPPIDQLPEKMRAEVQARDLKDKRDNLWSKMQPVLSDYLRRNPKEADRMSGLHPTEWPDTLKAKIGIGGMEQEDFDEIFPVEEGFSIEHIIPPPPPTTEEMTFEDMDLENQGPRGERGSQGLPGPQSQLDTPKGPKPYAPKNVSPGLMDFVKKLEGFSAKPYGDFKQFSIGYGTRAKKGEKFLPKAKAEKRLLSELQSHRKRVLNMKKKGGYAWTPRQVDALTSFDFNTGGIGQLTANGQRDNRTIAKKMLLYTKAGGKTLPGLERRRAQEFRMFMGR